MCIIKGFDPKTSTSSVKNIYPTENIWGPIFCWGIRFCVRNVLN